MILHSYFARRFLMCWIRVFILFYLFSLMIEMANQLRWHADLTDFKTISNFRKEVKKGKQFSKLVSADGGFAWVDENYQEQEAYPLVIGQILSGLMVQDKNGHMVVKLFETFTKISLKLINLMSLKIEKPFTLFSY